MTMRRALAGVLTVLAVVAAFGVARYAIRARRAATRASATQAVPSPAMPTTVTASDHAQASQPAGTPRGDVTIDPRRQQLIGVRTVPVKREAIDQTVRAVGQVRYDETRLADVNLKLEGWIRDLYVDYTGQFVRKGQPLFTLYSPDLLTTENEYLLALKTRDQLQQSVIPDARQRADDLVASARQRLTFWDLPEEAIRQLEASRTADSTVVFRAPVEGFVIEKHVLKGQHVTPGQTLYKVADLGTVWVEADVYETESPAVRVGAAATISVNAYPAERFTGRVIYIYPYVDETTRTNKVRFELASRGGRLKPGMYADVELKMRGEGLGVTVPTNALLDSATEQIVFVAKGDGMFEPRKVRAGRRMSGAVEILDGLKEGEQVATGAAFFLDSESQLRASLQGYEPSRARAGSAARAQQLDITFHAAPDPPKTGENQFEVSVKDASGTPIDDADVSVHFFMAAMPTMNMPAMRNEVKLSPAGGGLYRGTGQLMMAGRWDASVTVTRGGQRLGAKQLSFVVR
jgi:membrane fusion protein, copper/silver efflux system